jgi:ankyrin repeat domain-containing protein 50
MIASIDPDSVEEAKRALTWLCFAKRPMTVEEIIDGLAVELEPNGRFNKARRLQNGNDILHICPGLITISTIERDNSAPSERETPQYVVHIAHFSVQEYLESTRILDQVTKGFRLQSQASNAELAQICLIYLLDPGLSRATLTPADLEAFPLAEYAATYWYKHIVEDEDGIRQVNALAIELLQGRRNAFLNCIRINDPEYPWRAPNLAMRVQEIPSPLYYASLLGLYHSVLYILKSPCVSLHLTDSQRLTVNGVKYDVNVQGGIYGNALQAASVRGHETIVELLLNNGADINAQGGVYGNALQAASVRGHETIVELLLNNGADINTQGGIYGNAIQEA